MDRRPLLLSAILFFGGLALAKVRAAEEGPPRVGVIADYPATGLLSGCANFYVTPPRNARAASAAYIFLCAADGGNAWMNLNGRDTRLRLVRSWTSQEADPMQRTYYSDYRAGETRIRVESRPQLDSIDGESAVTIILRRENTRRVVRGLGSSDC